MTAEAPKPTENPKDALGKSKPCISFIPSIAISMEGVVMALGGRKYGPFNWRETSVQASVYSDAAFRHLAAWNDGEENDPEFGRQPPGARSGQHGNPDRRAGARHDERRSGQERQGR